MKKLIIAASALFLALNAKAQISIGPKLGLGLGQIKSKNLQDNLDVQRQRDSDILMWEVKNRPGLFFSLGGFFQYDLNDKLSFLTEFTFNRLSSAINIDYEESDVDFSGSGDLERIESKAKINVSFFSLPLLVKYNFFETGPFFIGGFRLNFVGSPNIASEETRERESYANGSFVGKTVEFRSANSELNAFGSPRLDFVLGGGTVFEINGKKLFLDIRYNHPLSRTEMYTGNFAFHDVTFKNNELFSFWGKTEAEMEVPGIDLDDFRIGFFEISAAYALFSK